MPRHRLALLLCCCVLAACGGDKRGAAAGQGDDALPQPAAATGSVTGMPDPGVAGTPPPRVQAPDVIELPEPEAVGDVGMAVDGVPADQPGDWSGDGQQAVAVLRRFYSAINAHDFAAAQALWGSAGPQGAQFASEFTDTQGVSVEMGPPGPIEAAAGSRYIEIPLAVEARQEDGSIRRYAGSHTLRRSVVDGATPDQQAWHIASAEVREVVQ